MWNYSFTLPSALILLILAIYYFRRPRMPIRMNKTFLMLLCVDAMTVLYDYVSSRVDESWTEYAVSTCYVLNLAFFIFFLARIYCFFLYILDILENHVRLPAWVRRYGPAVLAVSELIALSSPWTHAVFRMDESGYHSGPLYVILYVCFFFYLTAAAALILHYRRRLPPPVRAGLTGVVVILVIGNIARMMLPRLLVMNTFCMMAILAIYLSFGNPDLFASDRGHAFNTRALTFLLREWNQTRSFRVLAFIIRDYSETRGVYGGAQMDTVIGLINRFLAESYPECLNFYIRNGAFALVWPGDMDCRAVFEKLSERFRQPWRSMGKEIRLKFSFVEADMEENDAKSDRILSMLLLALDNAAKAEYADEHAAPASIHAIDRYLTEKRTLDKALANNGLELYLQPIMDSASGKIIAAEALARLKTEDGAIIPPAAFIPIAEKDGSIVRLGEQIMRKVCLFIRGHDMEAMGLRWINVNLSPYQCMNGSLAGSFGAILKEYGVAAELIHLELTEQSILDYGLLKNQIGALQELGFQFSLDDYGSGYSNLTRVKQYPFHNIKLDMEIVWNHYRDRDALLPTLIQVFKQMDFSITAEGIESADMAALMTDIGCDYLQGFHFSKPIPVEAFLERYSGASAS